MTTQVATLMQNTKIASYYFGRFAEIAVIGLLLLKGYRIIGHRYTTPHGEIDIVCITRTHLVIVEVKARKHIDTAASAISLHQQQRLKNAARYLISTSPHYAARAIRFDCCAVTWYMRIRHITNAFM